MDLKLLEKLYLIRAPLMHCGLRCHVATSTACLRDLNELSLQLHQSQTLTM